MKWQERAFDHGGGCCHFLLFAGGPALVPIARLAHLRSAMHGAVPGEAAFRAEAASSSVLDELQTPNLQEPELAG